MCWANTYVYIYIYMCIEREPALSDHARHMETLVLKHPSARERVCLLLGVLSVHLYWLYKVHHLVPLNSLMSSSSKLYGQQRRSSSTTSRRHMCTTREAAAASWGNTILNPLIAMTERNWKRLWTQYYQMSRAKQVGMVTSRPWEDARNPQCCNPGRPARCWKGNLWCTSVWNFPIGQRVNWL